MKLARDYAFVIALGIYFKSNSPNSMTHFNNLLAILGFARICLRCSSIITPKVYPYKYSLSFNATLTRYNTSFSTGVFVNLREHIFDSCNRLAITTLLFLDKDVATSSLVIAKYNYRLSLALVNSIIIYFFIRYSFSFLITYLHSTIN